MLSPDWITALQQQSDDTRYQASQTLLQTQQAITTLSNAALADIATQIAAEETDIKSATANLTSALKTIDRVQGFLNAAADLLNVVGKIVTIVH
jgi:hypothetical protein